MHRVVLAVRRCPVPSTSCLFVIPVDGSTAELPQSGTSQYCGCSCGSLLLLWGPESSVSVLGPGWHRRPSVRNRAAEMGTKRRRHRETGILIQHMMPEATQRPVENVGLG